MSLLDSRRSALVLVDYQSRLMPSIHDAASVLAHAVLLGRIARALDVPAFGTEENPAGLGPNDEHVRSLCAETLAKQSFDASGEGLLDRLRGASRRLDQVVVAGCEAHVCLLQTSLGLLAAGFEVFVVPDACGSRRPSDKELAMQRLAQSGATLSSVEMVAFEWLRTCEHPRFREVLALVKASASPPTGFADDG
jgi:nicotinamidase-related amidase